MTPVLRSFSPLSHTGHVVRDTTRVLKEGLVFVNRRNPGERPPGEVGTRHPGMMPEGSIRPGVLLPAVGSTRPPVTGNTRLGRLSVVAVSLTWSTCWGPFHHLGVGSLKILRLLAAVV